MSNIGKVNTVSKTIDFDTVAWISSTNVYDKATGEYTTEINQNTIRIQTAVSDLKTEKPETIGFVSVSVLERFLNGEIKACPVWRVKKV
jgi:hypothetical protein